MDTSNALFFVLFTALIGIFAFRMYIYGGFKGAMYGARIERTIGEVPGEQQSIVRVALKVHALLDNDSEKLVGIQIVAKSFASYQMMPITLSVQRAQQLISFLQDAMSPESQSFP